MTSSLTFRPSSYDAFMRDCHFEAELEGIPAAIVLKGGADGVCAYYEWDGDEVCPDVDDVRALCRFDARSVRLEACAVCPSAGVDDGILF